MSKRIGLLLLFIVSCSTATKTPPPAVAPKEFSRGELILGSQLLQKIFDEEMSPIECVPDKDEASLLLRTIRPRMEVVEDDMEASLDDSKDVEEMIKGCEKNCTCGHVDDLLKEHQVPLTKRQKALLTPKKIDKENNRCLNYIQNTFCKGELYQELNKEKKDFSFDEEAP